MPNRSLPTSRKSVEFQGALRAAGKERRKLPKRAGTTKGRKVSPAPLGSVDGDRAHRLVEDFIAPFAIDLGTVHRNIGVP